MAGPITLSNSLSPALPSRSTSLLLCVAAVATAKSQRLPPLRKSNTNEGERPPIAVPLERSAHRTAPLAPRLLGSWAARHGGGRRAGFLLLRLVPARRPVLGGLLEEGEGLGMDPRGGEGALGAASSGCLCVFVGFWEICHIEHYTCQDSTDSISWPAI